MEEDKNNLIVTDVAVKTKSKLELYRIITTKDDVFLPPLKEWIYKFIRMIIIGKKQISQLLISLYYLKSSKIKWITVPNFKGFTKEDLFKEFEKLHIISRCLPELNSMIYIPNKTWLCNLRTTNNGTSILI